MKLAVTESISQTGLFIHQSWLGHCSLTERCRKDVQTMGFDIDDVKQLVCAALSSGSYLKSEWCIVGQTDKAISWAACDSYRLFRNEWVEYAHKEMRYEYYVKFAIGKTGKLLLLVSCHLSR
jgi:hypothetical protein